MDTDDMESNREERIPSVASFPPESVWDAPDRLDGFLLAAGQPTTTSARHARGISRPPPRRVTAFFHETDIRPLRGVASPFL